MQDCFLTEKHDLLIAGGRCSWALEKFLERELPAVTLTTAGRALSDAMDVAFVQIKADL